MILENPFITNASAPDVYVTKGRDAYENTRQALTAMDLSKTKGLRVLLKPNIGRPAKPGAGVTTNPQVIAAAIDAFQGAGAMVAIGESPILGTDLGEAYRICGVTRIARERACPLLDMDRQPPVEMTVPHGKAIKSLQVCADIEAFDIIVSIPVMKMHMHTHVTLSIKNMKGCLWQRSKVKLHRLSPVQGDDNKPINIAIADLSGVLRPHLAIIDGSVGMEGMGPSAGSPKELGVVVVSADPFAADSVACELMGTTALEAPHLAIAAMRGYGVIDIKAIRVHPLGWRDWVKPFDKPPDNLAIQFPDITVLDKNSCSACQSTLLLFLKEYADGLLTYFPGQTQVQIAIGKGHKQVPEKTLCIGNCMAAHKDQGVFVQGCPPVSSEILKALKPEN
ncbi:MAG: DUF362 domain-containing protein [Pseudomonadota bacterium]